MATLTVTIVNGEATVKADGSKLSCATAHDVEKALGKVTKTVATGTKVEASATVAAR
jgi:hypothetical protein